MESKVGKIIGYKNILDYEPLINILSFHFKDPIDALAVKYTGVLGSQQSRYDSAVINQLLQDTAN